MFLKDSDVYYSIGSRKHARMLFFSFYQHYRVVDVSTVKELVKRWSPEVAKGAPEKKLNHRALDDIRESIEELRYYRETVFK